MSPYIVLLLTPALQFPFILLRVRLCFFLWSYSLWIRFEKLVHKYHAILGKSKGVTNQTINRRCADAPPVKFPLLGSKRNFIGRKNF